MENVKRLLDEVKKTCGIETDYALAKTLGIRKQRVSEYYKGTRAPNQYECMRIAEILEKPLDKVITIVEIDAEKDETRREAWKRHLKSLGGIAASFMLFVLSVLVSVTIFVTSPAEASENQEVRPPQFDNLQIMRLIRGLASFVHNMINRSNERFYWLCWPDICKAA